MITVQLSGTALTVRGHAGFSRYGSDIVCAAASMLAFTLAAAMEEAGLQRAPEIESACGNFRIAVRPREGERARVEAVFAAIGAGYRLLAARYPEYVRVMDEDSPENSRQRPEDGPENGQKEEKDGETGMAAGVRRAGAAGDRRGGTHAGAAGAAGGAFAGGHAGADAGAARGGDAAGLCAAEGAVCRGAGGLSAGGAEPGAGGAFAESPEHWSRQTREELKTRARRGETIRL